jgi:hypothetical protein
LLGWQEKTHVTQFGALLASFSVKPFLVRAVEAVLDVWRECALHRNIVTHTMLARHPFCTNFVEGAKANWTVIYPLGGKSLTDMGRYD